VGIGDNYPVMMSFYDLNTKRICPAQSKKKKKKKKKELGDRNKRKDGKYQLKHNKLKVFPGGAFL